MKSPPSHFSTDLEEQGLNNLRSVNDSSAPSTDELCERTLQQMDNDQRKELVSKMVKAFSHQQHPGHSFTHAWNGLKKFSQDVHVDLKPLMVDALNKNTLEPFALKHVLEIIRDFHWDPDFLTEPTIDALMKKSDPQEAEEVLSHIPHECITARNGSLLYKTLRSHSFEDQEYSQSVVALLQRIDPLKCVKPRFQDVSPDERILVAANLVPFLSSAQQSQLLTLLDGSLNRTKNKLPLQRIYELDNPKAQEFVRVWDHFKSQQKSKGSSSAKNGFKHKI